MRDLNLFNTVHGGKTEEIKKVDKTEKRENISIFEKIDKLKTQFVNWANSSVGEPIFATIILTFFFVLSLPLIIKVIKVIFFYNLKSNPIKNLI